MLIHMPCLLESDEGPRKYSVQDFLDVARSIETEIKIVACDLYRIPSLSSWRHEFLLVHVRMGIDGEKLMFIIERVPRNNGTQEMFPNDGVAKETITVMRTRENHEYWQRSGQAPVYRGTLQWRDFLPPLSDIIKLANTASTMFEYYNCYVRRCCWYARIILASMAEAFPPYSKEGTTSFSKRRFAVFGDYKFAQVELLVNTIHGHNMSVRTRPLIVTPDFVHLIRKFLAGCLEKSLAQLLWPQPAAAVVNGCRGRTLGRKSNTAGGWT
ncbi:hypothetical protein EDD17DRAFT_1760066 [Pisolithus thermaeus]|nr:hypothetical protein EV401DRAFT_2110468 [Pisolithus croceorrhizus]KAI6160882.1 hypothetical protein EDD17DRAFT_1760066 [Pisolithus thermaeus]